MPTRFSTILLFTTFTLLPSKSLADKQPNIILIMVDDMGFSDIGYHGSEIKTPHIDQLAHNGVRFSNFYNNSRCCPTRAALLTGLHPHQTGVGHMTRDASRKVNKNPPFPAYQGYLNSSSVTIAEALQENGYSTLLAGKWHLGMAHEDHWPLQRGFQKFYGCLAGATHYFHPSGERGISSGNTPVNELKSTTDRAYYTTDAFTDHAIRFIEEEKSNSKPYFLYLAYTAPHWPVQAHEEDIDIYRDSYHIGWDIIREKRFKKQLESGLIAPNTKLSPRDINVPAWDTLTEPQKKSLALRMAIYAAMIDRVDQNIGKLVTALKNNNQFDDTVILFLSDNGACHEGGSMAIGEVFDIEKRNREGLGVTYGGWSNTSSTPFRLYKHYSHEGGTATPFFIHWPDGIKPQKEWYRPNAQLIDIMPTLLEISNTSYPKSYKSNPIKPIEGVSLTPSFEAKPLVRSMPLYSEHEGHAFIIDGKWKLVGLHNLTKKGAKPNKWELYDLEKDRTEINNLANEFPEKVKELAQMWDLWANQKGVFPKP